MRRNGRGDRGRGLLPSGKGTNGLSMSRKEVVRAWEVFIFHLHSDGLCIF